MHVFYGCPLVLAFSIDTKFPCKPIEEYLGNRRNKFQVFRAPHLNSSQSPKQPHELYKALPAACINLVLDVYILLLPIAGVSKLQLPIRKKLGVVAVHCTDEL